MEKEIAAKLLDKAAQICVSKHAGQRDKMGCAYFQHPMRVAMRCKTDDEKIVALLHDTIEDTDVTEEYLLAEGFPQYIVDAVLSVTKQEGEDYGDFVARAKQNPIGRWVKLHDLEDNLDVLRLNYVSKDMADRFTKYLAARQYLLQEDLVLPEEPVEKITENLLPEIDVANEYNVTRIILSREESCRQERARINKRLKNYRVNGGTEYMKNKITVHMPDNSVIDDFATYSSLIKVIEYIGIEKVAALGLKYGQKPIVTKDPKSGIYEKINRGWYVLKKWPTLVVAQYVNKIADALDLCIECNVTDK